MKFAACCLSLAIVSLSSGAGASPPADTPPPETTVATEGNPWSLHAQTTYQLQGHSSFSSPYSGPNSFEDRRETRGSSTTTLFLGRRVWRGGELYVNPELAAGTGVSRVLGLAGPPNGETYRVDSSALKLSLGRLFIRQTWETGGSAKPVESDANQVSGTALSRRFVVTAGRFSGTDVFDGNAYAHDPRTQFNNWSLWANAAWDYPADTRGYTYGLALEAYRDDWALRLGSFLEPKQANGIEFDHHLREAHGEVLEIEHDHAIGKRAGAIRILGFLNHARMGLYSQALADNPEAPDVTATRRAGRKKYGFGVNAEQALTANTGIFLRAGWNDGKAEAWAFTEVERTATAGISVGGSGWHRRNDRVAVAIAWNGINHDHRAYLAASGLGFMLGDGRLRYGTERVVDGYYSIALATIGSISIEAQRFNNLGFNRDRGPVTVYGTRLHLEY